MAIVESIRIGNTDKDIEIRTEHGIVYVSKDFAVEFNHPAPDFVAVTDKSDGKVFWFNKYSIVWIGPR